MSDYPDPFQIPITLYRNAAYTMPITLQDTAGYPYPTDGYVFRLEIAQTQPDRSWQQPPAFSQQLTAGSGTSGISFVISDYDTAALDYALAYQWRVLAQAPAGPPAALIGGVAQVLDGPAMLTVTPA
jgi:hypothetical protein